MGQNFFTRQVVAAVTDYHGQMNQQNFEKWMKEMFLPNIPPSSVIILDNAPYHSALAEKVPTKYSTKQEMIDFLRNKGVNCNEQLRKGDIFPLVETHRPRENMYKVD